MIVYINKHYSANQLIGTSGNAGFIRDRKYDMDMNRLSRYETRRELGSGVGNLGKEIREMNKELNQGRLGKWQDTD
jgi:hypothetical protein